MQAPQPGLVVGAVCPVLDQVGSQNNQQQLEHERQVLNPCLQLVFNSPTKGAVHHQVGGQQYKAHHHMVDDKVVKISLPFRAKHRLVFAVWK